MKRVTLNIGLAPGDRTKRISPVSATLYTQDDRLAAVARWAVEYLAGPVFVHRYSGSEAHEPFMVLEGGVAESHIPRLEEQVYRLAAYLDQDCIAMQVYSPTTGLWEPGRLVGPYHTAWEPFQSSLFHTIHVLGKLRLADPGILDRLS